MKTIFHDFTDEIFSFHRTSDGFDPGYLHFHTYYEISVVKSGEMQIINNGTVIRYNKPCILIHRPYSLHAIIASKGTEYDYYVFHFNPSFPEKFSKTLLDIEPLYIRALNVIPVTKKLSAELYPLLDAFDGADGDEKLKYYVLAALLNLSRLSLDSSLTGTSEGQTEDKGKGYIKDVTEYIGAHFSEPVSAENISAKYYISRQKLDADFKAVMLETLKQYILDVRISNSMKLLSTGVSLIDAAYRCGFKNESHFITTFRKRIGISPYRYSKNSGSDKD